MYNSRFEMMQVNGTHHVHLNNPEVIAPKISEFLQKFYIKDTQDLQSTFEKKESKQMFLSKFCEYFQQNCDGNRVRS